MFIALLLLPLAALASTPELICDPDAKVSFESNYLFASKVRLEGERNIELSWTGHESVASARTLKEAGATDEDVMQLPDNATFVDYAGTLFIQRELLRGQEGDGLVIARIDSKFSVFHCRSR